MPKRKQTHARRKSVSRISFFGHDNKKKYHQFDYGKDDGTGTSYLTKAKRKSKR